MSTPDLPAGDVILAVPMQSADVDALTIRDYLVSLLAALWENGDGFSGGRPFGNSGWQYDLYAALGRAGILEVAFDEDGFIEECDDQRGDQLIAAAIQSLRAP